MKTYRINYNHNYWTNGSGWSNSETMETWEEEAESFEDLEKRFCEFDFEEAEMIREAPDWQLLKLAEAEESDTEIEIEAVELDEDGDEIERRTIVTKWLSEIIKESWRYKDLSMSKPTERL